MLSHYPGIDKSCNLEYNTNMSKERKFESSGKAFLAIPVTIVSSLGLMASITGCGTEKKANLERSVPKLELECSKMTKFIVNLEDKDTSNDSAWNIVDSLYKQSTPVDLNPKEVYPFVKLEYGSGKGQVDITGLSVNMPQHKTGDRVFVPLNCRRVDPQV